MGKNIYTWESAVILTFFMSWWYSQWYSHKICEFPISLVCFFPGSCLSSPSSSAPTIQELGLPLIFRRNSHSLMTHGSRCCELGTGLPQKRDVKITMKWGFRWLHHIYPTIKVSNHEDLNPFCTILPTKKLYCKFSRQVHNKMRLKMTETNIIGVFLARTWEGRRPWAARNVQKMAMPSQSSKDLQSLGSQIIAEEITPLPGHFPWFDAGFHGDFHILFPSKKIRISCCFPWILWMILDDFLQPAGHCLERRSSRKAAPEPRSWILSICSCSPLVRPRHGIRDVTTFWPWYWRCWRAGGQVFQGDGRLINSYYPMKGWEWISIYQLFSCELTGYRGFGSLAQLGFSVRKHVFFVFF